MHLNQINSFLAISKTLNFTSAARQLGIPQSTISRQINDLEGQLGVRLFYRTRRDVRLTDEGRAFLPYAREMAEAAASGTRAVRQLHDGLTGRLSIAAAPAAEGFLAECLPDFHREYPDVIIDLTRLSGGDMLMDDVDSPHDFVFLYRDMLSDSDEYEYLPTHSEPIGLAMSRSLADSLPGGRPAGKGNPAKDPSVLADALPSLPFVLLSEEADPILYMQAMNYCRTHRFTPHVINTFPEASSVLLALRSGIGVSLLPAAQAAGCADEDILFFPLEDESYAIPCIAAWKSSLLNPAASLFLEIMKKRTAH